MSEPRCTIDGCRKPGTKSTRRGDIARVVCEDHKKELEGT